MINFLNLEYFLVAAEELNLPVQPGSSTSPSSP